MQNPAPNPSTVLGRRLGDELRRLREAAGLTTVQAAGALDCTKGEISRIENGRVAVRVPDLTALMEACGVGDPEVRERLGALARRANRRRRGSCWHQYGSVLGDTYRDYIEMEPLCDGIRTFQGPAGPGTPPDARVRQGGHGRLTRMADPGGDRAVRTGADRSAGTAHR
jgi:transcriptional regulator with XRE-family HTH domain